MIQMTKKLFKLRDQDILQRRYMAVENRLAGGRDDSLSEQIEELTSQTMNAVHKGFATTRTETIIRQMVGTILRAEKKGKGASFPKVDFSRTLGRSERWDIQGVLDRIEKGTEEGQNKLDLAKALSGICNAIFTRLPPGILQDQAGKEEGLLQVEMVELIRDPGGLVEDIIATVNDTARTGGLLNFQNKLLQNAQERYPLPLQPSRSKGGRVAEKRFTTSLPGGGVALPEGMEADEVLSMLASKAVLELKKGGQGAELLRLLFGVPLNKGT